MIRQSRGPYSDPEDQQDSLIPRQLEQSFEEEPEYELVSSEEEEMEEDTVIKDHCKKGLELLETMNETGYNEEMYRQLANTFMKIHQKK